MNLSDGDELVLFHLEDSGGGAWAVSMLGLLHGFVWMCLMFSRGGTCAENVEVFGGLHAA